MAKNQSHASRHLSIFSDFLSRVREPKSCIRSVVRRLIWPWTFPAYLNTCKLTIAVPVIGWLGLNDGGLHSWDVPSLIGRIVQDLDFSFAPGRVRGSRRTALPCSLDLTQSKRTFRKRIGSRTGHWQSIYSFRVEENDRRARIMFADDFPVFRFRSHWAGGVLSVPDPWRKFRRGISDWRSE